MSLKENEKRDLEIELKEHFEIYKELLRLYKLYQEGNDEIYDYGLSFEYDVEDNEGFFRWLLSWGGPSTEFRFFTNPDYSVRKITYVYMDWFVRSDYDLTFEEFTSMSKIFTELFKDTGECERCLNEYINGQ